MKANVKVTVRLMIYNPVTRKWRQEFSITRNAPLGMADVAQIYRKLETNPPVRNIALFQEEGGIIKINADKGQLSKAQISKLKRFALEAIQEQIPPRSSRR